MKASLRKTGAVALFAILAGSAVVGLAVVKGKSLDTEGKAYADKAIGAIVGDWDQQEVLDRASPEFMETLKGRDLHELLAHFERLGKFQTRQGAEGQSKMSLTRGGLLITAAYSAILQFDSGPAAINLSLIRHHGKWQIFGLRIDSKVFLKG